MPIKFRCPNCRQFLGISRAKAGTLSDCPTCGRTLRVPALDGTLAPLPAPKLNLEDSELRDALGALACLNDEGRAADLEFVQVEQPPLEQPQEDSASEVHQPVIIVEPIVSAPEADAPAEMPVPIDEQLEQLAGLSLAEPILESNRSSDHGRFNPLFVWSGVAVIALLAFLMGRLSAPGNVSEDSDPNAGVPANLENVGQRGVEKEVANPPQVSTKISGSLTYVSMSGDVRPDKGARILVLPKVHSGSSKLSGEGFRVGANEIDQNVLKAAAKALGGGFTLADSDGKYEIDMLAPGEYSVLIESRYQPRDDSVSIQPDLSNFLEEYFEHPSRVLGQIQHVYREIKVTSGENVAFEFQFEKQ